jgi:protein-disulfide isomerase
MEDELAKKKAPQGANNTKLFYGILAAIAVIGIGAIFFAMRGGSMATEPLDMTQVGDAGTLLERARGEVAGTPGAPVQIHVFSDYMCPACAHWAGVIEPPLKAEFVETGRAVLTYYDFPLQGHRHSFVAARAARCAGDQGRFWAYHDHLFGTQQTWMYSASTPTSYFQQLAGTVGLDQRQFDSCLRSDTHAELVTANLRLGETLGVRGTPTVFINGRQLGDWSQWPAVREAILAAGGGAPAPGTGEPAAADTAQPAGTGS